MKCLLAVLMVLLPAVANAGSITVSPPQSPSFQYIAANVPAQGNVWTGVGQSVTAMDTNVDFGFYLNSLTNTNVVYTLYSGDGTSGSVLGQTTVSVPASSFNAFSLVLADFSGVSLTVGQQYTFVASLVGLGLPAIGTYSDAGAAYAGLNNPYAAGRFYFTGSSYNLALPAFADRDLAFSMVGVDVAGSVPEPGTWAMMLLGFGAIGIVARKRRRHVSVGAVAQVLARIGVERASKSNSRV